VERMAGREAVERMAGGHGGRGGGLGALFRWCRGRVGAMGGRVVGWGWYSGGVADAWGPWVAGGRLGEVFRWCRSFLAQPPVTGRHPSGMQYHCARIPVVSLGDSLNRRLQAGTPAGVQNHCARVPVVSLVPRSTAGYRLASLLDAVAAGCGGVSCQGGDLGQEVTERNRCS
jgi:hypothetical protein